MLHWVAKEKPLPSPMQFYFKFPKLNYKILRFRIRNMQQWGVDLKKMLQQGEELLERLISNIVDETRASQELPNLVAPRTNKEIKGSCSKL